MQQLAGRQSSEQGEEAKRPGDVTAPPAVTQGSDPLSDAEYSTLTRAERLRYTVLDLGPRYCVDCGAEVFKTPGKGRWPRRCPECRERSLHSRETRYCETCGAVLVSGEMRWCYDCAPTRSERARLSRLSLKAEVIAAYGGRCSCECGCGEDTLACLTLDHVDNNGSDHQRELFGMKRPGSGWLYRWAKAHGYPDTLRVLCWNCNCGRQVNGGICPKA